MEPRPFSQEGINHTTSLLTSLNLQREQAQFCDCVVRQRHSPGQLYPAHRCVLAASSPVLASILSSTGALVELQAPCLSGSVLALLLDYIYTGTLPHTGLQQHYYSLLTAARYLQMDNLQGVLRAWHQTEEKDADKTNSLENWPLTNTETKTANSYSDYERLVRSQNKTSSVERDDVETCDETQLHSADVDSCFKNREAATCGVDSLNEDNCRRISERCTESSINTENLRQVTYLTHQGVIQHPSCAAEVRGSTTVEKKVQEDQFHSVRAVKPDTWPMRNSSSSPYPCCGAVPVIRHSSKAETLQLADVPTMSPYHPVSFSSSRVPESRSARSTRSTSTSDESVYLFQKTNHIREFTDDSAAQRKVHRGLTHKNHLRLDDFPSKRQKLDRSDSTAAEDPSRGPRAVAQDSDTGSDSNCEYFSCKREDEQDHCYSSRCPAQMDTVNVRETDRHSNLQRSETNAHDGVSSQHEYNSDNRDSDDVSLPTSTTQDPGLDVSSGLFAFEQRTSLYLENISDTFTMSVDSNASDLLNGVGQSYQGRLYYHCLPKDDTHLLQRDSDHKHTIPVQPDYSDQSIDEDEARITGPGATRTTDQVLLLDISAKPELLVSYKHRSEDEEDGITFSSDREQRNEATSAAEVDERKIKAYSKCGNAEERKSFGNGRSLPGVDAVHTGQVTEELSDPKVGDNQRSTLTACSPALVPDCVQASVASALSVSVPSTVSANVPTNVSAHLSTPVLHPFQCSLCDRSFSQRGSLNRHVRSHLGVRPFPCPCCPMTFSRQYRVIEHMRVHQRCMQGNDFDKPPASSV